MILEHRTYTVHHGTMAEYLERYEKHGLPVQLKHLGRSIGSFVSEFGSLNQVLHLWVYDDLADRMHRRARLEADPAWTEFKRINRGSFVAQEVKLFNSASFSLLRPDPA